MKRFEKFLFFYGIVAVTSLFIAFGIFSPKPLNLISISLLIPIIFYFWVRLTSPESATASVWSIRFVTVVIILIGLGIFAYHIEALTPQPPAAKQVALVETPVPVAIDSPVATPKVAKPLAQGVSIADLVTQTPVPETSAQQVTGKPGIKMLDVFQDPFNAPQKTDTIDAKLKYAFSDKQNNWYKINYSATASGWVSTAQAIEVQ